MKFLITILLLFYFKAEAQPYVANWSGWGHNSYTIQSGIDSVNWNSIGTVTATSLSTASYQFTVPGANYYYRVIADKDSTAAVFVPAALDIKMPPGQIKQGKTAITNLSVKVYIGSQIHYTIESPRSEPLQYSLYDVVGRKLSEKIVPVFIGINHFYDDLPIPGIYYAQFVGYFETVPIKIPIP